MSNENKNQNAPREIVIDDGSITYKIKNKQGNRLGEFSFRPSDTNFLKRYNEIVEYFNNFSYPEDAKIEDVESDMVKKVDYLINADASQSFFSILGAFSVLASGELFIENVINAIGKVIESEMNVRTESMTRRMNKYVAKYQK